MAFKVVFCGDIDASIATEISNALLVRDIDVKPMGVGWALSHLDKAQNDLSTTHPNLLIACATDDASCHALASLLDHMKSLCSELDIPVLHISNYFALAADHLGSVDERQATECLADNHLAKLERTVAELDKHVILRHGWLMDGEPGGLFAEIVPILLKHWQYSVDEPRFGCPISTAYLVDTVVAVVRQLLFGAQNWGSYHLCSALRCSESEFAIAVLEQLEVMRHELKGLSLLEGGRSVFAANAELTGRRLLDDFGVQPLSWRKHLGAALSAYLLPLKDNH